MKQKKETENMYSGDCKKFVASARNGFCSDDPRFRQKFDECVNKALIHACSSGDVTSINNLLSIVPVKTLRDKLGRHIQQTYFLNYQASSGSVRWKAGKTVKEKREKKCSEVGEDRFGEDRFMFFTKMQYTKIDDGSINIPKMKATVDQFIDFCIDVLVDYRKEAAKSTNLSDLEDIINRIKLLKNRDND